MRAGDNLGTAATINRANEQWVLNSGVPEDIAGPGGCAGAQAKDKTPAAYAVQSTAAIAVSNGLRVPAMAMPLATSNVVAAAATARV